MRKILAACLLLASCASVSPDAPDVTLSQDGVEPPAIVVEVMNRLLSEDPLSHDAIVIFHPIVAKESLLGLTSQRPDGTLQLEVEPSLTVSQLIDVLEHEWAHAMVWDCAHTDTHDELWGVAFSRAYRTGLAVIDEHETRSSASEGRNALACPATPRPARPSSARPRPSWARAEQ